MWVLGNISEAEEKTGSYCQEYNIDRIFVFSKMLKDFHKIMIMIKTISFVRVESNDQKCLKCHNNEC